MAIDGLGFVYQCTMHVKIFYVSVSAYKRRVFMIDLAITVPMLHAKHNTMHQNQNAIADQRVLCGPSLAILEEMWISRPWRMSADIGIQPVLSLNSQLTVDSYSPS